MPRNKGIAERGIQNRQEWMKNSPQKLKIWGMIGAGIFIVGVGVYVNMLIMMDLNQEAGPEPSQEVAEVVEFLIDDAERFSQRVSPEVVPESPVKKDEAVREPDPQQKVDTLILVN